MRAVVTGWLLMVPLWLAGQTCPAPVVGNPDGNYVVPGSLGDITYKPGLALDAYAPPGPPRPAALVIRGRNGNRRGYVTSVYEQLAQDGYAWFAPSFRGAEDLSAALDYIRCPGRFNIGSKLVLIGDDTGAAAALRLAAKGGVAGIVMLAAKLEDGLPKPEVPVLMIHGSEDQDTTAAQAQAYCSALKHCTYYAERGASHGFESWFPSQWDYKEELDAWLVGDRRGLWTDIAYSRPDGRALTMNAYIPKGDGPFPAVIVMHGGGFEGGDKVVYVAPIFKPLAKAGIAWFSIDYREQPYAHNQDQIEDLRAAIRNVRQHPARYHVDPARIAILGESSSGQAVTLVAAQPCAGCEVSAVVCFYGIYKFEEGGRGGGARLERMFGPSYTTDTLRQYSPLAAAHKGMPPVLVLQGDKDSLMAGSNEYVSRLKELGVPHEYVVIPGAPHGMENWEGHPEWAFYRQKVVEWLRATLRF